MLRYEWDIDLERLLKLRLAVARFGEMDIAGWWNTKGMLGRMGRTVLARGMPKTHPFAQAKVVFAVARERCREVFDLPGSVTLWDLPAEIEDWLDDQWHVWLDELEKWNPLFSALENVPDDDLIALLKRLNLLSASQAEKVGKLRRALEGRAVPIQGYDRLDDDLATLLAAGFSRGEKGKLAVPYAPLNNGK